MYKIFVLWNAAWSCCFCTTLQLHHMLGDWARVLFKPSKDVSRFHWQLIRSESKDKKWRKVANLLFGSTLTWACKLVTWSYLSLTSSCLNLEKIQVTWLWLKGLWPELTNDSVTSLLLANLKMCSWSFINCKTKYFVRLACHVKYFESWDMLPSM